MAEAGVGGHGTFTSPPKEEGEDEQPKRTNWRFIALVVGCIVLLLVLLVTTTVYGQHLLHEFVSTVRESDSMVVKALIINVVLYVFVICCLPGPIVCIILNGFVFGFWLGFLLGVVTETLASMTAIALGRVCLKGRIREWTARYDSFEELVMMLEEDATGGFLVLIRFLVIPIWIKNYGLSVLDASLLKCLLVILPGELWNVGVITYVGSKMYEIGEVLVKGQKGVQAFSGPELVMVCVSGCVFACLIVLGYREYWRRRRLLSVAGARGEAAPLSGA